MVVVLTPHEDAAPVGKVIGNNRQSVPPGFHHSLHVMETGVAAQVGWLKPCINLSRFLQLNDLLCRLEDRSQKLALNLFAPFITSFCLTEVGASRPHSLDHDCFNFYGGRSEAAA